MVTLIRHPLTGGQRKKKYSGQQHPSLTCARPRSIFMIEKSGGRVLDCLRNMDMGPEKGVKYSP